MADDFMVRLVKLEEKTKNIENDISEIKKTIKDIDKKLNGYLDKKIETKIKTMDEYFSSKTNQTIDIRMGKWMIAFAVSVLTTWLLGFLSGRYWIR